MYEFYNLGLQYTLPALWNTGKKRNMSLKRVAELLSEEPAKLANLQGSKGHIKEGYDADLVVLWNLLVLFLCPYAFQLFLDDLCLP